MFNVIWPPGRPPELPELLYPDLSCKRSTKTKLSFLNVHITKANNSGPSVHTWTAKFTSLSIDTSSLIPVSSCIQEKKHKLIACGWIKNIHTLKTEAQRHNCTCSMASARCLLSFCSLLRSFSMSHCRSSTVVSISDTLVSELVTLSTNSLYCNSCKDVTEVVLSASSIHANNGYTHTDSFSLSHKSPSCTPTSSNAAKNIIPPWTSCGVCPAGEWPGLGVECCPPAECGSG